MAVGLSEVGARLVLAGKEAYVAGLREAEAAQSGLERSVRAGAAAEQETSATARAASEAKARLAEATRTSQAASREYEAAVRAQGRAESENAAVDDAATRRTVTLARARTEAAATAKAAAETEVVSAKTSADAAVTSADKEVAARERQKTAAESSAASMKTALLGAAVVAGTAAAASTKMAVDFEADTTRLVTSGGEAVGALDTVRQGMLALAPQVGVTNMKSMSDAMYTIESAGYHAQAGLAVLKAAEEGARAEGADATTVANALSSAMRDYYPHAASAAQVTQASAEVMSKLIGATSTGKVTFQDLSGALHSVLPAASAAHVSLEDVLGSLASMTVHGTSAQQASENLAHAIGHLQAVTAPQTKALAELGFTVQQVQGDLSQKGLTGVVNELSTAIQQHMGPDAQRVVINLSDALKKLDPAVRDVASRALDGSTSWAEYVKAAKGLPVEAQGQAMAFATLAKSTHQIGNETHSAGELWTTYSAMLKAAMGDQTGMNVALQIGGQNADYTAGAVRQISASTADAQGHVAGFAEVQKTSAFQWDQMVASIKTTAITLGATFLPTLNQVAGAVRDVAGFASQHTGAMRDSLVVVGILVGLYATYAATTKAVAAAVSIWRGVQLLLTGELWATDAAMAASPIGLVVTAIVALVAVLIYAYNHSTLFRNIVTGAFHAVVAAGKAAWDGIKAAAEWVWSWLGPFVHGAINGIVAFFRPMVDAIRSHWDEIAQVARVVWAAIRTMMAPLIASIVAGWNMIKDGIKLALDIIMAIVRATWTVLWTIIKVAFDIIVTVVKVAWDIVVGIFKWVRDIIMGIITVFLDIITGHWQRAWQDIKDFTTRTLHDLLDAATRIVTDLWHGIQKIWNDAWQGTKDVFTGLWHDMKKIFADGANIVIDIVNGFLDVVNKVAGAIGFNIHLNIPHVPEMAEGGVIPLRFMAEGGALGDLFGPVGAGFITNGPRAIVGEGNPAHPEYVIPTDPAHRGNAMSLFHRLAGDLAPGFHAGGVARYEAGGVPGRGVPGFDGGGILGGIWHGITNVASSIGNAVSGAVDWIGRVTKEGLRRVVESVWPVLPVPENSFAGLVPATINTWRAKALDWLVANTAPPAGGGPGGAAPPGQINDWIMQALSILGYPPSYAAGIYQQIMTESSGNPGIVQQIHDVNSGGNEARGIMQVIPTTFASNALPGHGNIFNPVDNIIAGARHAMSSYGPGWFSPGPQHSHGYASGGVIGQGVNAAGLAARLGIPTRQLGGPVAAGQPYMVGEAGPEIHIPDAPGLVMPTIGGSATTAAGDVRTISIGGTTTINLGPVYVTESGDSRRTYDEIRHAISDATARM